MKTINETFTDTEFNKLKKLKKKLSWHDFIMSMYNQCIEAIKREELKE